VKSQHVSKSSSRPIDEVTGTVTGISGYYYTVSTTFGYYFNVPSIAGKCNPGDQVFVRFGDPVNRRHPLIVHNASKVTGQTRKKANAPLIPDVYNWLQAMQSSNQSAIGGKVDQILYRPNPDSYVEWPVPTSNAFLDDGTIHEGIQPYGLTRFPIELSGTNYDFLAAGYQYVVEESGGSGWKIGFWPLGSTTQYNEQDFGAGSDPFVNVDSPKFARFFSDPLNGWCHLLPDTDLSPARILSAKIGVQRTSYVSRSMANASLHSFKVTSGPTTTIESWLCFPAVDATSGGAQASIDFYQMNQTTGEFTGAGSFDSAYIPDGGPSVFPDQIASKSYKNPPGPWLDKEYIAFGSGGLQDVFDSDKWVKHHWALRSLKTNGTEGSILKSKTTNAVPNPNVLSAASLKSEVTNLPFTLVYDSFYGVIGGVDLGTDSNSAFAHFSKCAPILLLTEEPNNTRMEPEQFLFGGDFTAYNTGTTHDLYLWSYYDSCVGTTITGYTPFESPFPVSGAPSPPTVGSPQTLVTIDGCSPGVDRIQSWGFDPGSPGQAGYWRYRYTQKPGWAWRTKLYSYNKQTNVFTQTDVSQLISTSHSVVAPTGETVTATQTNFPIGNNIWQIASFPDKGLVCLLRDLHADGPNNNPTPHLEIYRIFSGSLAKVKTIRLGSYSEKKTSDNLTTLPNWMSGDQEWNPYYFGRPRLKSCRQPDGTPVILILVQENKKVDIATESGFKRAQYTLLEFTDPSDPTQAQDTQTSPDLGVGNSGDIPGVWPLIQDFDTMILTPGHVTWARDSRFRRTTPP